VNPDIYRTMDNT